MPGSLPLSLSLPRPAELLVRLTIAAMLVIWPARVFEHDIVARLLPLLQTAIPLLDSDIDVLDLTVGRIGSSDSARLRANLAHPVALSGGMLRPFAGWVEINLTLGGAVAYSVFELIVVLAWPAMTNRELAVRVLIAIPLALLLLIHVPLTLIAEIWNAIYQNFAADESSALLRLSRFIMGGGGFAVAATFAAIAIVMASERSNAR